MLRDGCFDGLDLVVIDVDDPLALEWAPRAAAAGARVVDNSAAFRMDPDVPLVVAEVNPDDLTRDAARHRVVPELHDDGARHRARRRCTAPRGSSASSSRPTSRSRVPVSRGSTSSTSSGPSSPAPRSASVGPVPSKASSCPGQVWSKPIAGNVIPLAGSVREGGYTSEEWKLVHESRKILHDPTDRGERHLRARPGVRRARDVGQRAVPSADEPGRGRGPPRRRPRRAPRRRRRRLPHAARGRRASIRCSSDGSARIRRGPARSTSGSRATTSARAPRSTPCRWPSSCSTTRGRIRCAGSIAHRFRPVAGVRRLRPSPTRSSGDGHRLRRSRGGARAVGVVGGHRERVGPRCQPDDQTPGRGGREPTASRHPVTR